MKGILTTLAAFLGAASLAYGAGGLSYPGGLTTQSAAGCVRFDPSTNPVKFVSTGVPCGTANAAQSKTFSTLGTPSDGTLYYCSDCTQATPCAGSGTGSFAQRVNGAWQCSGGGSGSAITVDLGDDGGNDTTALSEIAPTNDTNGIFAVTGTKLGIDVSDDWPQCDVADDLVCTNCIGATEIDESTLTSLSGSTTIGGTTVCLSNGTNCPVAGGSLTDITTDDTNTNNGPSVGLIGGDGIVTSSAADDTTITLATTEVNDVTWGAGAPLTWTFNAGASDPLFDVISGGFILSGTVRLQNSGGDGVAVDAAGAMAVVGAGTLTATDVSCSGCVSNSELATDYEEEAAIGTTAVSNNAAASQWLGGTGTGFASWQQLTVNGATGTAATLAGTSGSSQTITIGDTITIAAGTGITTTGGSTDTVTVASTLGTSVDLTSEVTGVLPDANVADDITIANTSSVSSSGNLITTAGNVNINAGRLVVGLTPNHSCVFRDSSSDRLFGDKDCDSTKDAGEEFLDYSNNINSAFALYVDKAGADSTTCGPINDPCLTIAGANGAHAKITAANDNGFATCSLNTALGCGRCSTTTATQCNETADCPGGETCAATDSVCSAASAGTCAGATKGYTINIGAGWYAGSIVPPSPGSVTYKGDGRWSTTIYDNTSGIVMDWTNRTGVLLNGLSVQQWGAGDAIGATGGSVINGATNIGVVHWGAGWDINLTGADNRTNVFIDFITFGSTAGVSGNSVHFQSKPYTCSNNERRECTSDGDCTQQCDGGTNDGAACTVASQCPSGSCPAAGTCTSPPSHDFFLSGAGIQTGAALGGRAVWFEAIGCGDSLNLMLDNVDIAAADGGGATGSDCTDTNYQCGLVLSQTSCLGTANMAVHAVKGVTVRGFDTVAGFVAPDRSLDVASNATLVVDGSLHYDACTRNRDGTLTYSTATGSGGGPNHLGELRCTAPPDPVNGERWYDTTQTRHERYENSRIVVDGERFVDGVPMGTCSGGFCTMAVFEGGTDDAVENTLRVAEPASGDKTIDIPNVSGTLVAAATAPLVNTAGTLTVTQNAGTDVTADLEEENHCADHDGTGVSCSSDVMSVATSEITGTIPWGTSTASQVWSWVVTATDPVMTFSDNSVNVSTGVLKQGGTNVMVPGTTQTDDLDLGSDTDASVTWRMQLSGVAASAEPRFTFSSAGVNVTTSGGGGVLQQEGVNVCTISGTQTLTNKTLTTPTIGSFTNATHTHVNAAGGGQLTIPTIMAVQPIATNAATTLYFFGPSNAFENAARTTLSVPTTSTVRRLFCSANAAPDNGGGTQSYAVTLMENGSAQSLTCTISEASTTCSDTSNTYTTTAGDTLSFRVVPSGTPIVVVLSCGIQIDIPLT